ncbi:NUDIX hydrolase [Metabacillus bambusae]|uniref:NUDIX domain-containing protein n=1 Tax=Metabacillus bambusae TaxID=2795218 RepID=A0ABS3MYY6_9BACI|nr:NUDIX domain-containing protein [Metabacillus bambusae]MBO1511215.1 NUDIX domain-containing protein [Metabacillus bambusae]
MDYIKYIRNMVGNNYVILVAAGALVLDEHNRLLLHKRSDNEYWGVPGGFMELGESAEETARRELYEETGIILGEMELFNVYSGNGRKQILENGHKFYDVIILFKCKDFKGDITLNNESLDVKFFSLDSLPDRLFPSQKDLFEDLLSKIHKL